MALSWLWSWVWGQNPAPEEDNPVAFRFESACSLEDEDDFLNYSPARRSLDTYIADMLQPTREFNTTASADIHTLVHFLQSPSFPWRVGEVIKGGSLGKGTHVKRKSDIDLVVYLNGFSSHEDFLDKREQVRAKLKPYIDRWQPGLLQIVDSSPGGWQVLIRTAEDQDFMEGDILLAVDNLGILGGPEAVYCEIQQKDADFYTYSYSLNELQVDFIQRDASGIPRSPKLKSLIRLIKKWRDQYLKAQKINRPPINYAFELLTIHVWEKAGKPTKFSTKDLFRCILEMLVDYKNICATWEVNYKLYEQFVSTRIKGERPLILDPANPFYNVAKIGRSFYNWGDTARKARQALESPLMTK